MSDAIRQVCAWCQKHLAGAIDTPVISHGICLDCKDKLRPRKVAA